MPIIIIVPPQPPLPRAWLSGEESICNAGVSGDRGWISGSGRFPREGNGSPLHGLAWRSSRTEEPGGLQSMGLQRAGCGWVTDTFPSSKNRGTDVSSCTSRTVLYVGCGLPRWHRGGTSRCRCSRHKTGSIPGCAWGGKIPWRNTWQPTPVFLPGKFHGSRGVVGYWSIGSRRVRQDWSDLTWNRRKMSASSDF